MKTATVLSSWMDGYGYRLDCQPYLGGALETKVFLESLSVRKDPLSGVTKEIYHAGRESRRWVESPEFGIPFISSSDLQKADLSDLPLISKRQVASNPAFLIKRGFTLITRSGTIGRTAYCRREMDGMACSEHVLRIVPDPKKIAPGYLYCYLASKFGIPLVVSGTYGSIIQSIEPEHVTSLPVPRIGDRAEQTIHEIIEQVAELRTRASGHKRDAISLFEQLCGFDRAHVEYAPSCFGSALPGEISGRMDASYYVQACKDARAAFDIAGRHGQSRAIGDVAKVFIPTIFKRIYADDPQQGYPYITGADVFDIKPTSSQYLMRSVAIQNRLLLETGMIVVQEAGQRYGLLGRGVMVGRTLNGFACTNNMVRLVPHDGAETGYIYAVLSSDYGLRLVKREAAGSSIPHLDADRVASIQIPWLDMTMRRKVSKLALSARDEWDQADDLERQADAILVDALTKLGR